jgi:hypothetical protein
VVFYITPALYGFVNFDYIGYFFAFAFIFIRELCQFLSTTLYNRENRSRIDADNSNLEADAKNSLNSLNRSFTNGFYDSQINILETILTITTFLMGFSLCTKNIVLYNICLIGTILLGTIEVSVLLIPIVSKHGIYWVSNKICFKAKTFSLSLYR